MSQPPFCGSFEAQQEDDLTWPAGRRRSQGVTHHALDFSPGAFPRLRSPYARTAGGIQDACFWFVGSGALQPDGAAGAAAQTEAWGTVGGPLPFVRHLPGRFSQRDVAGYSLDVLYHLGAVTVLLSATFVIALVERYVWEIH